MTLELPKRPITVATYIQMVDFGILREDEKVELINGDIIEMTPIGSSHASVVDRITDSLTTLLAGKVIVRVQSPVQINDLSMPEPDISVLRRTPNFYVDSHPGPGDILMLIEVAKSTVNYDRQIKLPLYASAGIPEFWLVNLEENVIEAYFTPIGNRYAESLRIKSSGNISLRQFDLTLPAKQLLG